MTPLPPNAFQQTDGYRLLPFRFERLPAGVLLTNDAGEHILMAPVDFDRFVGHQLGAQTSVYFDLKARHFLAVGQDDTALRVLASKIKTKKGFLAGGPKLHIVVPTLRCNQSCGYCQVSRANCAEPGRDMDEHAADRAVDLMLAVRSQHVTLEFQGGEPLLRFDLIRRMVERAAAGAGPAGKRVTYVVCTNLTLLEDEHLEFFARHGVIISTSLDGPAYVHDRNRPLSGAGSHALVVRNIERCREALGHGSVSALMTTTVHSLPHAQAIIDEYVRLDLSSLFLRDLNPYGFAARSARAIGYEASAFLAFYQECLGYILDLNRNGTTFVEALTTTLLRKILTPFGTGFVDLQSPTGEGFSVMLYNYDGSVYPSDEARMLAEMGDASLRLGSVDDDWSTLFSSRAMQAIAAAGCAEALAGCADCAFVPYCGADPIRHWRTQGDLYGHRPSSDFCRKYKALFRHLFALLAEGDPDIDRIFWAWLTQMPVADKHLPRPEWLSA